MTAIQPAAGGDVAEDDTRILRGSALRDLLAAARRLPDAVRRAYLRRHLRSLARRSGDPFRRSPYYALAEADTDHQWEALVWPWIRSLDFTRTLELAPGHGRHSVRLCALASELTLVDINEECLGRCRERLGDRSARVRYLRTDGYSLDGIDDGAITTAFTFDAMVHFHPDVVRSYLQEFARVLSAGGRAFCHHSNHASPAGVDFRASPHWRNHMSLDLFGSLAESVGLEVLRSEPIDWGEGGDLSRRLDGLTLLRRP